uniref:Retrovirus-related Pol polyprotein from transposon TNT 1-94 n=1 Tax=Lygus hesperus TaxID=30085 RepID=A0A0A9XEY5_LYGHE
MSSFFNSVEKLKGRENYDSWKVAMRAALRIEKLWKDVIELKDAGVKVDPEKDEEALSRITLCIEKVNYSHIQNASSAKAAWDSLAAAYEDSGLSRRVALLRTLVTSRYENYSSAEQYCDEVLTTAQKLNDLKFVVSDEWVGTLLLAGLPDEYRPMIMGLENSGTKITGDIVKVKILQDVKPSQNNDSALVAKNRRKFLRCHTCNKVGHFSKDCHSRASGAESKQKDCKKPNYRSNKNNGSQKKYNDSVQKNNDKSEKQAWLAGSFKKEGSWYLDSGASSHISCTSVNLVNMQPADSQTVSTADQTDMVVKCKGRIDLNVIDPSRKVREVQVNDVLFIPEAAANLLSVSKIASHGCTVTFSSKGGKVFDKNGVLIATASVEEGLYRLHTVPSTPQRSFLVTKDEALWHRRLGHLNNKGIGVLKNNSHGIDTEYQMSSVCEVCLRGKHSRKPFRASGKRASNILDLVHSDLVGPMEKQSFGGNRYILTLIDDHSRKVFVYLLKEKSEVPKHIEEFRALVERQTERKIKVLRTDNGTEYCNNLLSQNLKKWGIVHQTSTRYSPNSNGRAERAQRTLVEKARSMLADADLPKHFWAEAVLTAAYLMNRSPSRALGGKTPYEIWHQEKPDLSNLRIFGCDAWVQVPKQLRKKWDEKSTKLVFVGYPQNTKGYRLVDPKTEISQNQSEVKAHRY